MSQEKLQAFAKAISKSEELQKRFWLSRFRRKPPERPPRSSPSCPRYSVAGTAFLTAEEYLRSVAESSEQLSAEQLHAVAGGAWDTRPDNFVLSIFTVGIACGIVAAVSAIEKGNVDKCQPGLP